MNRSTCAIALLAFAVACGPADPGTEAPAAAEPEFLTVTEENYSHAETARNFRNWARLGADTEITHMRDLPPRGHAAPTVQMNDDTLYSIAIVEAVDGNVAFSLPQVDVYMAVQVQTEGGHGPHYVVEPGDYELPVETAFAFLIYRTGTERGLEAARAAQDQISTDLLNFGEYALPNYDFEEVEAWTARLTAETQGTPFAYTFPRTAGEITDLHQWNLENANGWGGSSPEVGVSNLYTNSTFQSAAECLSTTFTDPQSTYFTSITAYDADRYLIDGTSNVNSHSWATNGDGMITVSFNCGDEAPNNIDTQGQDFSFTMRYYGVSQSVVDGDVTPEKTVS
ncbi:MAG: DUF1254 domain-containing protein [Acidobacteria bacterium]|nr:DUF1254 domain-containing protein [Acidobacteriota bacterium]